MKTNPSYTEVNPGDVYVGRLLYCHAGHAWTQRATVLAVDDVSTRFGKPDRVVTVKVTTNDGRTVDEKTKMWVSQLLKWL